MSLDWRFDRLDRGLAKIPEEASRVELQKGLDRVKEALSELRLVRRVLQEPGDMTSKFHASKHISDHEERLRSAVTGLRGLLRSREVPPEALTFWDEIEKWLKATHEVRGS